MVSSFSAWFLTSVSTPVKSVVPSSVPDGAMNAAAMNNASPPFGGFSSLFFGLESAIEC
jgi:hypothetical protein